MLPKEAKEVLERYMKSFYDYFKSRDDFMAIHIGIKMEGENMINYILSHHFILIPKDENAEAMYKVFILKINKRNFKIQIKK